MLIRVMYPGNTYDYVREFMLNNLIEAGKIVRFRRSGGGVSIVEGPVRSESLQHSYRGTEKRVAVRPISSRRNDLFQTESIKTLRF
jgi:hypothetical protein